MQRVRARKIRKGVWGGGISWLYSGVKVINNVRWIAR
jgi:hypothetical protein